MRSSDGIWTFAPLQNAQACSICTVCVCTNIHKCLQCVTLRVRAWCVASKRSCALSRASRGEARPCTCTSASEQAAAPHGHVPPNLRATSTHPHIISTFCALRLLFSVMDPAEKGREPYISCKLCEVQTDKQKPRLLLGRVFLIEDGEHKGYACCNKHSPDGAPSIYIKEKNRLVEGAHRLDADASVTGCVR